MDWCLTMLQILLKQSISKCIFRIRDVSFTHLDDWQQLAKMTEGVTDS